MSVGPSSLHTEQLQSAVCVSERVVHRRSASTGWMLKQEPQAL